MLINIPIEPIPMRYSSDWDIWFKDYFTKQKINFITIYGNELTKGIEQGRFLDCIGTNYYKSTQLIKVLNLIYDQIITKNDILFFHDLWFPGIEQIKYVSDLLDLNLKITGCLHAGCYDPNDFLYQKNLGYWAVHFEHMLFQIVDKIFVATNYHKDLILKNRSINPDKIKITGFPIFPKSKNIHKKQPLIVFPHRKDPEKNPELFDELKCNLPNKDWSCVSTFDQAKTKDDYYNILESSCIAVSFSDQETWGIAMIEAVFADCLPLVPDKLSYQEMYLSCFKYKTIGDFYKKLKTMIFNPELYFKKLQTQKEIFQEKGKSAIPKILIEINNI
jgi:hypothetical protein